MIVSDFSSNYFLPQCGALHPSTQSGFYSLSKLAKCLVNVKYLFHTKYSLLDTMALTEHHQSSFAYFTIVLVWKVSMAEWWRVSNCTSVVPRRFPLAFCLLPRIPCHGEQNHQCCEIFGCCHGIVAYYMYKNFERFKLLNSQPLFIEVSCSFFSYRSSYRFWGFAYVVGSGSLRR